MPNRDYGACSAVYYLLHILLQHIAVFFKEKIDIFTVSNAVRECDSQHSSVVGKRVVIETAIVFDL